MPSFLRRALRRWWDPELQQALDDYEGLSDEVEMLQITVDDLRSRVLEHHPDDEDPT